MHQFSVKVSAPGKVILHGEHSVVFGKTAIAVSLGLRTSLVLKNHSEPIITITLPSVGIHEELPLELINKDIVHFKSFINDPESIPHAEHLSRTENLAKNTIKNFDELKSTQQNALIVFFYAVSGIFGGSKLESGFSVHFTSDLTVGAGTGSSASFSVCLSAGLLELARLQKGAEVQELNLDDKKLISKWAYNCERIMHGTPSGIDNTIATFGSLVSFRKGQEPEIMDLKLDLRILLVDTQVSRQTQVLTRKVRELRERNTEAVDCILESMDHITKIALQILQSLSSDDVGVIDNQYRNLAELWNMNHSLLGALGVSHPALESIRASAEQHGLACKLTGAGGGGYAIVLIPPSTDHNAIDALTQELIAKGFKVTDAKVGGPGVTIESQRHD